MVVVERWARELGKHFLAITASFMFPRLAFVTLKDNLMVLSLRAMLMQFMILMLIAAFCFCGFLYVLWTCVSHTFPLDMIRGLLLLVFSRLGRNHVSYVIL